MPRIIEIVLFLAPFVAFFVWRRYVRSFVLPLWFLGALSGLVLAMLLALLWSRHEAAGDAHERYAPAVLRDGEIIPGGPVRTPP